MNLRHWTSLLLFVLVIQARDPSWAAAQEPEASASPAQATYERHMDLGVRLFEDRNYDAAISEFELAYEAKRVANPLINIALCHKGRFEYPKAIQFLERALRDHRDTVDAPEKIDRAITELRELLATVVIILRPTGIDAEVFLDGQRVDSSELARLRVSPGGHDLVARAEGYAEARAPFRVASGNERVVELELVATSGLLSIVGLGRDDRLSVDGVAQRRGTRDAILGAGSHLVVIYANGGAYTLNVPVVAGGKAELTLGEDGLLRMDGIQPRGPDEVLRQPVRGLYATAGAGGGLIVGTQAQSFIGFDANVGYQATNSVGVGLTIRQAFPLVGSDPFESYLSSVTQIGPALRLMTNTDVARFVTAFDLGFSYSIHTDRRGGPDEEPEYEGLQAPGAWIGVEPGLDLEINQFLLGFTTPLTFNLGGDALSVQLFGRLHFGYGFW